MPTSQSHWPNLHLWTTDIRKSISGFGRVSSMYIWDIMAEDSSSIQRSWPESRPEPLWWVTCGCLPYYNRFNKKTLDGRCRPKWSQSHSAFSIGDVQDMSQSPFFNETSSNEDRIRWNVVEESLANPGINICVFLCACERLFLKLTREPFADGKYTAYCVTATEAPGQYYGRSQSVTRWAMETNSRRYLLPVTGWTVTPIDQIMLSFLSGRAGE